jgi:excisionase family DNA binding protein
MLFPYAPGATGSASEPSRDSAPSAPAQRTRAKPGPRQQTSAPVGGDPGGRWLSIEAACKLLGVDQSTLRRWSDSGKIPVYRTPGGHRRYAEDDLNAIMRGEPRQRRRMSRQILTTMSMSGYEHDYLHQAHARPWYRAYDAQSLDELRPLGRRMVDLTIRYISGRGEREEVLDESREIGRHYGQASARAGLSTADALEAFLFFRTPVIQAVTRYIEDENVSNRRAARITSELTHFMDEVLIATIAAHQHASGD